MWNNYTSFNGEDGVLAVNLPNLVSVVEQIIDSTSLS